MPSRTARCGSRGVLATLRVTIRPLQDSTAARSVKVPPTSIPMRSVPGIYPGKYVAGRRITVYAEALERNARRVVSRVAVFVSRRRRRGHPQAEVQGSRAAARVHRALPIVREGIRLSRCQRRHPAIFQTGSVLIDVDELQDV